MTERESFIVTILADPDDDMPRLVYSDWLVEHGEEERAEFIRVQCALAKLTTCPPNAPRSLIAAPVLANSAINPVCPAFRWHALRRRERELLDGRAWGWAGTVVRNVFKAGTFWRDAIVYRRGFVEEITCSAADWLAHANALLAAQPIRRVRLTTWPELANIVVSAIHIEFNFSGRPVRRLDIPGVVYFDDRGPFGFGWREILAAEWPRIEFELPTGAIRSLPRLLT